MEMLIGQLAKLSGVGTETIRYYERRGLLAKPRRAGSGYRYFDERDTARLRFIRRAKELGFSLGEIKALLALKMDGSSRRSDVKGKVASKVREITERIEDLIRIRSALQSLGDSCDGHGTIDGCPILASLETPLKPSSTSQTRKA
jgi:Zn(II)-responsive transcriptional regulator